MLFVLCVALAVELLSCFVMFVVLLYLAALTSIVIIVCTVFRAYQVLSALLFKVLGHLSRLGMFGEMPTPKRTVLPE